MKTKFRGSLFVAVAGLGLAACTGQIGELPKDTGTNPGGPGTTGGGPGTTGGGGLMCNANTSFASARIGLLTDDQYVNAVRDVFGVTFDGDVTTVKSPSGEYGIVETAAVSTLTMAQAYMRAADQVSTKVKPCGTAAVTATCMEQFLRSKLPLAWRRPVTDAEIRGLIDTIFTPALVDGAPRAVQLTMEAALASPAFLYRSEIGQGVAAGTAKVTLTPYELASAVSFALTNSSPDTQLWSKALDGTIAQDAVLLAEVDRLMALPAVRDNLKKKVSYYLNFEKVPLISKDTAVFKQYTTTLQASLYQSSQKFLDDILWAGRFADLFTSTRIYANAEVAGVYGLSGVTGTQLVPVDSKAAGYSAGLLTHPALLLSSNKHTGTDDIVHRGLWVYDNLLCGISVGAPPANADEVFATLTGTEREKALKRDALSCGACHLAFDPLGLVTQSFDPIGRYRAIDPETNGPVDTTATIMNIGPDVDGNVKNVNDVAAKLSTGTRASDCAAVHLARYVLDHNPEVENSCEIQQVKANFARTGSFPDLFKAILTSPAFLTRDL
jgi:Protein of unknown function (DUF1592)/Protein of unknown function (DUF1588)/Protein of unknown function (DUF1595)